MWVASVNVRYILHTIPINWLLTNLLQFFRKKCRIYFWLLLVCGIVPLIVKSCVEFIESRGPVEGLYRLSGSTSRVQKLRLVECENIREPNEIKYHQIFIEKGSVLFGDLQLVSGELQNGPIAISQTKLPHFV